MPNPLLSSALPLQLSDIIWILFPFVNVLLELLLLPVFGLYFCILWANAYFGQAIPTSAHIACQPKGIRRDLEGQVLFSDWRWTAQREELWLRVNSDIFHSQWSSVSFKQISICTLNVHEVLCTTASEQMNYSDSVIFWHEPNSVRVCLACGGYFPSTCFRNSSSVLLLFFFNICAHDICTHNLL